MGWLCSFKSRNRSQRRGEAGRSHPGVLFNLPSRSMSTSRPPLQRPGNQLQSSNQGYTNNEQQHLGQSRRSNQISPVVVQNRSGVEVRDGATLGTHNHSSLEVRGGVTQGTEATRIRSGDKTILSLTQKAKALTIHKEPEAVHEESETCVTVRPSDEADECPICLEEYDEENPKIVTACKHTYHFSCILEWSQKSAACPICFQVLLFYESSEPSRIGSKKAYRPKKH